MYFTVTEDFKGARLDVFLASMLEDFSRSKIKKMLEDGLVLVNGKKISKAGFVLLVADKVLVRVKKSAGNVLEPVALDLKIVFEDDDILVIDKPFDLLVHPASGDLNEHVTLVHGLLSYLGPSILEVGSDARPGIVHRLDKDTSGLMVIAKTPGAYKALVDQFSGRIVKKKYVALVNGIMRHKRATIDAPLLRNPRLKKMLVQETENSKDSITHYIVDTEFDDASLLDVTLETGRTHQIRVHLASIGHPILGDSTYGFVRANKIFEEKYALRRQFLHAKYLSFLHPISKKELSFEAPLPVDLKSVVDQLTPIS